MKIWRAYAPWLLALSLGWMILEWKFGKLGGHLWLNGFRSPIADYAFALLTRGGEVGVIVPVFLLTAYGASWRAALSVGISALVVLVVVGMLKNYVFPDALRPTGLIDPRALHLVEGVKMHRNHSFPSGHTMAGFAWTFALASAIHNRWTFYTMPMAATLIGLSRIYLSQHFLVDVVIGAWLGCLIAWGVGRSIEQMRAPWLDKALFRRR
ncbi:phosphatase PAP2 family protein [bacterium]|nr:phosphatase PAP2 family protein [bacterium]